MGRIIITIFNFLLIFPYLHERCLPSRCLSYIPALTSVVNMNGRHFLFFFPLPYYGDGETEIITKDVEISPCHICTVYLQLLNYSTNICIRVLLARRFYHNIHSGSSEKKDKRPLIKIIKLAHYLRRIFKRRKLHEHLRYQTKSRKTKKKKSRRT